MSLLFQMIGLFVQLGIALSVDRVRRHDPNRLLIEHLTLTLPNLPPAFDGFTIVQISDMHIGRKGWVDMPRMRLYADHVMALEPDVIVNTGDFADSDIGWKTQSSLVHMLELLCAPEGVYGVLGNHDYDDDFDIVRYTLMRGGVRLLENEHVIFRRGEEKLYLAGVESARYGDPDLCATLDGIPPDACVILLVHEPDYADLVRGEGRVKLQLSGHTHGGQLVFPVVGPLYLPRKGKKYVRGLYPIDKHLTLYINNGLGMRKPPLRLQALAEITHITLRSPDCEQDSPSV